MKSRPSAATLAAVLFVLGSLMLCGQAQSGAYFGLGAGHSSAVDAKGVRHFDNGYRNRPPPWIEDSIRAVAPEYPYQDRSQGHEGIGLFKLVLDLRTGAVSSVSVIKSTGFTTLDESAIAALRQWRSKPGKWCEIQIPVTFGVAQSHRSTPGWLHLPGR
jgi:TonB family protein